MRHMSASIHSGQLWRCGIVYLRGAFKCNFSKVKLQANQQIMNGWE